MSKRKRIPKSEEPEEVLEGEGFEPPNAETAEPPPSMVAQIVATTLREIAMAVSRAEINSPKVKHGPNMYHHPDPFKNARNLAAYLTARADELVPPDHTGGHGVTITLEPSKNE